MRKLKTWLPKTDATKFVVHNFTKESQNFVYSDY